MSETPIHILAVDDDKISRKMIGRALADSGYLLSYAENGKQGLQAATDNPPDIIILDVEMPEMNGFEVCDRLRGQAQTASTPIVFLSSHSSLRERMQGYEVGANDYIVKPFENEHLRAKIQVLARYREEQTRLQTEFDRAQRTAMIAMSGSSELGLAIGFVEKSYAFHQYDDLAEALLQTCQQLQLDCVLMLLDEQQEMNGFALDNVISPLEKEMIEMVDRSQRLVDFGSRTIVNFPNLSLLVKNMPIEDSERYGRMKDLLPILLTAVDNKLNAIRVDQALSQQHAALMRTFAQIRTRLYHLAKNLINKQELGHETLKNLVTDLSTELLGMGLEEDQESYLLARLEQAIDEADEKIDASQLLYLTFTGILENLRQISNQQTLLNELFTEMNTVSEQTKVAEDDNIEFF